MSPEPFLSCAKVLLAKKNAKGYGDEEEDAVVKKISIMDWDWDIEILGKQN